MTLADEMHESIVTIAGERGWGETRESWIAKAARRAGISYRRAKTFFYREPTAYHTRDVEAVRVAVAKQKPLGAGNNEHSKDQTIAVLEARQERLERELAETRAIVSALLGEARGAMGAGRIVPGDGGREGERGAR